MARKDTCLAVLNREPTSRFTHFDDFYMVFTPGERGESTELASDGMYHGDDWFKCTWAIHPDGGPLGGSTIAVGGSPCDDPEELISFIPTREQVLAFDWESWSKEVLAKYDPSDKILQVRSMTGFFERLHCLMGFEDALCSFYEDPDSLHEFFAAMLEYKKTVVDCICQYMQPDIMIFDDDYGTAQSTFIDPKMWREFFPQYWKPLIDHVHSKGVKFELHSCGYVTPLVGDFVELGMDILQPVQLHNDIELLKREYGDKMIFRLNIFDKQMATVNQTEDEIRTQLRKVYKTLSAGGGFIAEIVKIDDPYYDILQQVQDEYEKELFGL